MSLLQKLEARTQGVPPIETTLRTLNRNQLLGIVESGTAWKLNNDRIERTVAIGGSDAKGFLTQLEGQITLLSPSPFNFKPENAGQLFVQFFQTTATIFAGRDKNCARVTIQPLNGADSYAVCHSQITISLPDNIVTRMAIKNMAAEKQTILTR